MTLLGQRPIQDLQLYAKVIKFLNPLIYIPQIKHRPAERVVVTKKSSCISARYPSALNDGICLSFGKPIVPSNDQMVESGVGFLPCMFQLNFYFC